MGRVVVGESNDLILLLHNYHVFGNCQVIQFSVCVPNQHGALSITNVMQQLDIEANP